MDPITVLVLVAVLYLLIYFIAQAVGIDRLKERGIEAGTPFFLMVKTARLNDFLTRLGQRFPRAFFSAGVVVAFGGMIAGFWLFGQNLVWFFFRPEQAGGVVPIVPGVTISGLQLVYMAVGLAITLLTHEFAHGLAAACDGIPIKSSGLVFFLVLFGGFVETDDEVFEKSSSPQQRMRVLAAGSFSNLIWGGFVFLLLLNFGALMSIGFVPPGGAYIYDIAADTPASHTLQVGDVIVGLNDTTIENWADVGRFMYSAPAGASLTVHTLRGSFNITLAASPANASRGYIGIYGADYWTPRPGWEWVPGGPMFVFHLGRTLSWVFLILISVALLNLLPIPALDGDRLLLDALRMATDNEQVVRALQWAARTAAVLIIVLNVLLSFLMGKGIA